VSTNCGASCSLTNTLCSSRLEAAIVEKRYKFGESDLKAVDEKDVIIPDEAFSLLESLLDADPR
jgi:hypothetical protein